MNKVVKGLFLTVCVILVMVVISLNTVMSVIPKGANYTERGTSTAPFDTPQGHGALAGNVTEMDVTGFSTTQAWQGYYGNVTGTVQLVDGSDNVMYNWSLVSPEGEVYAANHSQVTWTNVQCFNFTANGTYEDDTAQRGLTSLRGMNLSQLESNFGLASDDVDGVNETFDIDGSLPNNDGTHDLFYTNNLEFSAGECLSANMFVGGNGSGLDNYFEEVLLYDPDNQVPIFVAILDEEDVSGFDVDYHDFEMMVLDSAHGTDLNTTLYYFYVELE